MEGKKKTDLKTIPNVGKATERDLAAMGYSCAEDLKGKRAEELYAEECALRGETLDRCQLYLLRSVEYFVNAENPDRKKCKWWFWKDEYALPAPCGAVCAECGRFPEQCGGCRTIRGRVYWLEFTGGTQCPVYECCAAKAPPRLRRMRKPALQPVYERSDPFRRAERGKPEKNDRQTEKTLNHKRRGRPKISGARAVYFMPRSLARVFLPRAATLLRL